MGVHGHATYPSAARALGRDDVRRSSTMSAKLAMCLQPEFDHVSITVVGPAGVATTWVEDGTLARTLDRLQQDLGEGPCVDSTRHAECVTAPHIERDDRWPRYGRTAADLGLRSQVSAPLRWREEAPVGSLNMYSTTDGQIGLTAPLVAQVFAAQVASALAGLREVEVLREQLAQVTDELARTRERPSARSA